MREIVRYIAGATPDIRKRRAVREAVRLVLEHLVESGVVELTPAKERGGYALYRWRLTDDMAEQQRA